jgi:hypothetical protein
MDFMNIAGTLGRYMGGEGILARYLGRYKRCVE